MRILYFTERDGPHDQRFLKALAGTPHQVFALRQFDVQAETPEHITALSWPEGSPAWFDRRGWERGISQFKTILREVQPDLIHAGPVQGPAFIAACAGFHPLVSMSWGSDLLRKAKRSPWMQYVTRFTLAHSDLFFGDCETIAREAFSYGLPADKMVRFPWGVDLEHFSPANGADGGQALRKALGWEQNFVILCNRTWAPIYGVDVLARAFVGAVEENDDLRLLLIGDGPLSEEIHNILEPIRSRVSLPGWVDRESLPGAYCAADLFISPSHCDGSSISLLEALACGRPVLVSDIPSNQEWVTPGVVGELFPDGKVEALKEKILQLAADSRLEHYGRKARLLAEGSADWQKNFKIMLKGYERAVQEI